MKDLGTFEATAYGPPWNALEGYGQTKTGIHLPNGNVNKIIPIVAVDPSVIPLGSTLLAYPNPHGNNALVFRAEDTGGAIKGKRLDFLVMTSRGKQNAWGRRSTHVVLLTRGNGTGGGSVPKPVIASGNVKVPTVGTGIGIGLGPLGKAGVGSGATNEGIIGVPGAAAQGVVDAATAIPDFVSKLNVLFSADFWLRASKGLLGGLLLMLALALFGAKMITGAKRTLSPVSKLRK